MIKYNSEERQKFLDEINQISKKPKKNSETLNLLNWNISNPSYIRAQKQMDWIEKENFDIIILTETKLSKGCIYLKDRLERLRYDVFLSKPENNDYGIILAFSKTLKNKDFNISTDFLPYRSYSVVCNPSEKEVLITGVYIPVWMDNKKKKFLYEFENLIAKTKSNNRIIIGDFNLLEPNHTPFHSTYKKWEYFYKVLNKYELVDAFRFFHEKDNDYSWFGRSGKGYRFDHIFLSKNMLSFLVNCSYIHEPRLNKLSDHSAMSLIMNLKKK